MKITAITKQLSEYRIVITASFLLMLCFALYIYFLSLSVTHVVMRKEIQQDISQLNSEISALESRYIAAQHRVSDEIASLQGFQPVEEKIFIDRSEAVLVLSTEAGR